ncbi:TetR family transcriptional regulator [Verticiella sediminum]|uniref:TetR family transcriptional regulator n=1 Tax=Verticiella sediminum TaxID=1247510 RepID=A0A556ALU9_9BURK|nr:TetR family transcriptional regulator [Verticiella sediminum]TSH93869.1 TetR family transcriptional regulator [Verticiella sediminum]
MRQTKLDTEQTRLALLDAAESLFWTQGAARTSVLDIARTANLTRGAFYYHFKDKAAIFEALIERARALDADLPVIAEGEKADALATLRAFCIGVFERFVQDRLRQRVFGIVMHRREALGDLEPLAQARREEICRSSHAYERLLERARKAGQLSPHWTPPIAATTLYCAIMGLLDQWLRAPERFDVRTVGIACINQLLDSFGHRPATAGPERRDGTSRDFV